MQIFLKGKLKNKKNVVYLQKDIALYNLKT